MVKIFKSAIYSFVFFIIIISQALSQNSAVVLVQGKVLNKSGQPVGKNLHFINSAGKKTTCKANIVDGAYQLVLPSNEKYIVLIDRHILDQSESEYFIPEFKEYAELNKNFNPTEIVEGMKVLEFKAFEPGETAVSDKSLLSFIEIKEFMVINKNMVIELTISAKDCYFSPKKVKETEMVGKKKKTVTKTITVNEQIEELLTKREAALRAKLSDLKIREKSVTITKDFKQGPPPAKAVKAKKSKTKTETNTPSPQKNILNVSVNVSKIINM